MWVLRWHAIANLQLQLRVHTLRWCQVRGIDTLDCANHPCIKSTREVGRMPLIHDSHFWRCVNERYRLSEAPEIAAVPECPGQLLPRGPQSLSPTRANSLQRRKVHGRVELYLAAPLLLRTCLCACADVGPLAYPNRRLSELTGSLTPLFPASGLDSPCALGVQHTGRAGRPGMGLGGKGEWARARSDESHIRSATLAYGSRGGVTPHICPVSITAVSYDTYKCVVRWNPYSISTLISWSHNQRDCARNTLT